MFTAQLFSSGGEALWPAGGVAIPEIADHAEVVYRDGSFYFSHKKTGQNGLWLSKVTNGVLVWPNSIRVTSDNPAHPGSSHPFYWQHKGDYLIWDVPGTSPQVYALRYDSNGQVMPGFQLWGNQISNVDAAHILHTWTAGLVADKLCVMWKDMSYVAPGIYDVTMFQQLITPLGESMLNPPHSTVLAGDAWVGFADAMYLNGIQNANEYVLNSYTEDGIQSGEQVLNLGIYPGSYSNTNALHAFSNGSMLALLGLECMTGFDERYFLISPDGTLQHPAQNQLFPDYNGLMKVLHTSANQDCISAVGGISNTVTPNLHTIALQRIAAAGTAISDASHIPVPHLALTATYPNPFLGSTRFSCTVKQGGTVSIDVYNLRGQKVRELFCGILPKGEMTFAWDGKDDASRDAATGIYLIRAVIGRASRTIKLLKL